MFWRFFDCSLDIIKQNTFAFMNSEIVIVPIILLFIMLKVMKSFITPRKITMH